MSTESQNFPIEVDVHHVKSLQDSGAEFLFIDCREEDEYETAKIPGTTLIPMSQMQDRVEELKEHQDQHTIVHCHHGGRSMRVTQWLRGQEFTKVQNMAGGIDVWSQEIDESVPRY
ncbi:rhodanese-like domain-containing protein [Planctomicrobium sp.]|jgi:rhodanese-related sulfurtransferase|nr:rhodanese-like domain-containing protein [Planctomicrobium sp.]MDA7503426.1 rhodanese-like domain-containing protein [bacterium]MBT5017518.1 rhodanese [Planctomicrobium sp.]MDA7527799.1 rhodanese-like domain-containing protein [bacterium]MDB4743472.1 rhodanese-like domain-containing protein [Planctomicrobium sp.]MDB4802290.1 rhodanese-like domain-containing protein [bacterium]